jgi:hypothetical protein
MLHDPRRALAADHALVDRVVAVAVDVAHLGPLPRHVAQMHVDPAAAGAHVAGGLRDTVRDRPVQFDLGLP